VINFYDMYKRERANSTKISCRAWFCRSMSQTTGPVASEKYKRVSELLSETSSSLARPSRKERGEGRTLT